MKSTLLPLKRSHGSCHVSHEFQCLIRDVSEYRKREVCHETIPFTKDPATKEMRHVRNPEVYKPTSSEAERAKASYTKFEDSRKNWGMRYRGPELKVKELATFDAVNYYKHFRRMDRWGSRSWLSREMLAF